MRAIVGLLIVAVLVSIGGSGVAIAHTYSITDLGVLPGGSYSYATAINNGQVVGQADTADSRHAFSWTQADGMVDLGTLGGQSVPNEDSYPKAVNNGQVVGYSRSEAARAYHGFSWTQADGMVELYLGTNINNYSEAFSVSDGQVVGVSERDDGPRHAFSWTQADGMVDLGGLPGVLAGYDFSQASSVDNGQVVGFGTTDSGTHAFSWTQADGMLDLGTLPGGSYSTATAVDNGQVVGHSSIEGFGVLIHAFSWRTLTEGIVDLGTLPGGSYSGATAVDNGQVVGFADTASGDQHAFSWTQADGMVDLGTLGGLYSYATSVSNGQVVGNSDTADGYPHAFIWTQAGGMVDLGGDPALTGSSNAASVSNGQVVGDAVLADGGRAVLWTICNSNGIAEPGEACDGGDLGGASCQAQGFQCGTPTCNANCTLNTSGCANSGCSGKRPVIIIPGIEGSELRFRSDQNRIPWPDLCSILSQRNDEVLFSLLLDESGLAADADPRCTMTKDRCSVLCAPNVCLPFVNLCSIDHSLCAGLCTDNSCVPGGADLEPVPDKLLDIRSICTVPIDIYTSYSSLVNALSQDGYSAGTTLFRYSYDWRRDLWDEAEKFGNWLDTHFPNSTDQVDVIAHSMGGLLLRAYLGRRPDDQKIAQAIYLGTPHLGAPQAYAILADAHTVSGSWWEVLAQLGTFNSETQTFLAKTWPSAYELLPRVPFTFVGAPGGSLLESFEETLSRLPNQGLVTKANYLHAHLSGPNRPSRSFSISGSGRLTLKAFDLSDPGHTQVLVDPFGDGTVPEYSSTWGMQFYAMEEHDRLPGNQGVQNKIRNILSGQEDTPVSGISQAPYSAGEGIVWHSGSPIRVNFTDSSGRQTGAGDAGNQLEEIDNSRHFRFDQNEAGFLPFGREYRVDIEATDNGVFALYLDRVASSDGHVIDSTAFTDIPVSVGSRAHLMLDAAETKTILSLDVDGDGADDFDIAPGVAVQPEAVPPALHGAVHSFGLQPRLLKKLERKIDAINKKLTQPKPQAALRKLHAFIRAIDRQRGKGLTNQQVDSLIRMAEVAVAAL